VHQLITPRSDFTTNWKSFLKKFLGLDFSTDVLPSSQADPGWRLLVIPTALTVGQAADACRRHFKCHFELSDLCETSLRSARDAAATHVVRLQDCREADDPVLRAYRPGGPGFITLVERLVFELKFWSETGLHLDVARSTACYGTVGNDGDVPVIDWDARLRLTWASIDAACDGGYTRQVSL